MKPTSPHKLRLAFRALLKSDSCYHTASVFDPMSARIANDLGFEMGILGGSVASLQVLAAPDFALITLSEFVEQATRIGRVARLPIIADADHGYGNALNVMRTITELERAGVAALTIEDTVLPAGYGRKSTDLVSVEEGIGKIKGALEARIAGLESRLRDGGLAAGPVVPLLCRALLAFAEEDYSGCARLLEPLRADVARIGGSGAQREVIEDTLLVALLRGGEQARAAALLDERLHRRPSTRDRRWQASLAF